MCRQRATTKNSQNTSHLLHKETDSYRSVNVSSNLVGSLAYRIRRATSLVHLLPRAGQRLPRAELSRIIPAFGVILENPLPFPSFCVSVFRHPSGRPCTSSRERRSAQLGTWKRHTLHVLAVGNNEHPIR